MNIQPYGAGWKYWEAEAQAANRSMLPDTEKQREFARVEVEFSPPGEINFAMASIVFQENQGEGQKSI